MTLRYRHLRRARLWIFGLLARLVIVIGCLVALIQLFVLPWFARNPEWVSAKLSEMAHRPIAVDQVTAQWDRNGPLLNLRGVHVGNPAPAGGATAAAQTLTIASAGIKLNFFSWARRNASWTEFRVAGLELDLERGADRGWQIRGMDPGSGGSEQNIDDNALFSLGAIVLRDARLNIHDIPNDKHFKIGADELRLVNQGALHRVLARLRNLQTDSAPVNAVAEYRSDDHSGRLYLGGKDVDLAAVLRNYPLDGLIVERGRGRTQLWAWFAKGDVNEIRAEVDLGDLVLTTNTAIALDPSRQFLPHVGFERLALGARWQRQADGWSADVADMAITRQGIADEPVRLHLRERNPAADADAVYEAEAQALDLGHVASVAMLMDTLPDNLRRWLYAGNPEGFLRHAAVRFASAQDYDATASIDGVAWHAVERIPGLSGLSGQLIADQDALNVDLPQHNAFSVSIPRVFRQPLDFSDFSGSVAAYRGDGAWRIETDALNFEGATPGETYGGELRGAADIPDDGSKPTLDVAAVVTHAEVPASHLFWLVNIMPPPAVSWLDRGLDAGNVTAGRAVFRGNLADWPFRNNAGRFQAVADIADLRLNYLHDWPVAEHLHATANFVNTTLHLEADGGTVQNNRIIHAVGDIADLGDGPLELQIDAEGSGKNLLGYVRASPLGARFAGPLDGAGVGGQGKVTVKLHLPYKHIEDYAVDGIAQLVDADVDYSKYDGLHFASADGVVRFNRSGFLADKLATSFRDKPTTLSLAVGSYVADVGHVVEASVDTHLPVRDVLSYAPALNDYQKYTSGDADWHALFTVDRDVEDRHDAAAATGQRLTITSTLRGAGIDLPAPLEKKADATLPLKLVLTLPFAGADLDLRLGDVLTLRGRLPAPGAPFAANVALAGEASTALPKSGMVIGGTARRLDLAGWLDFAGGGVGGGEGSTDVLQSVDVRSPEMIGWDRQFGAGQAKLIATPQSIDLSFEGDAIQGSVNIPRREMSTRGITANLARLHWPASPESAADASAQDDTNTALNPVAIPPLHVRVADFRLGAAQYGQATVESRPIADGMHFDQVTTHSPNIDMRAQGDWTRHGSDHRSTFGIDLSAQDLGHMLDALGSPGLIDGGKIVAHIDASWSGAPSSFAISKINGGALRVDISNGRIPDIDVGAGRIAGLLNLAAIPRRLAFDFGDLFNKGYSFDSIVGTFTMTDGYAYTENLAVKSPTADMRLKGSMGLKTRDWDQVVEVTPHVGGTLFVGGGALIGGPVGAAAGALLQGVFKNQINAASRFEYKVTGSWDKPNIVRVAANVAPAAKSAPKDGK